MVTLLGQIIRKHTITSTLSTICILVFSHSYFNSLKSKLNLQYSSHQGTCSDINIGDYLVQPLHFTNEGIALKEGRDFLEVTQLLKSKADAGLLAFLSYIDTE